MILAFLLLATPFAYSPLLEDYSELAKRTALQSGAGLIIILAGIYLLTHRRLPGLNRPVLLPLCFAIWGALSLTWARSFHTSLPDALHLATFPLFFCSFLFVTQHRNWHVSFIYLTSCAGLAIAVVGVWQILHPPGLFPQVAPPAASFAHKNLASQAIVLTVIFSCLTLSGASSAPIRHALRLALGISVAYLTWTGTRAAWVSLSLAYVAALSGTVLPWGLRHRAIRRFLKESVAVGIVALLFFTICILAQDRPGNELERLDNRIKSFSEALSSENLSGTSSIHIRFALWMNGLAMVRERPILGFGIGQFPIEYPRFHRSARLDHTFGEDRRPERIHNDHLQNAIELGIPGALLLVFFLGYSFRIALRLTSRRDTDSARRIGICCSALIIAFVTESLFSSPHRAAYPPYLLALGLGLLYRTAFEVGATRNIRYIRLPRGINLVLGALLIFGVCFWLYPQLKSTLLLDHHKQQAFYSLERGNAVRALDHRQKALSAFPEHPEAMSLFARGALEAGHHTKAVTYLSAALDHHPYDIQLWLNLGVAQSRLGGFTEAINATNRALAIYPDWPKAHYNVGSFYLKSGQPAGAVDHFRRAVRLAPDEAHYHTMLGTAYVHDGKTREARVSFEEALRLDPYYAQAHWGLGVLLYETFRDTAQAVIHMSEYVRLSPDGEVADQFRHVLNKVGK